MKPLFFFFYNLELFYNILSDITKDSSIFLAALYVVKLPEWSIDFSQLLVAFVLN